MQVTINGAFSSLITSQEEKHGLNYYRCSCIDLIYYHFSKMDHRFAWFFFSYEQFGTSICRIVSDVNIAFDFITSSSWDVICNVILF